MMQEIYYRNIDGHIVIVTVLKPRILDKSKGGYVGSEKYCSAFRFDEPPGMIAGEFVREPKSNDMKWFDTPDEAADGAFTAAKNKLK